MEGWPFTMPVADREKIRELNRKVAVVLRDSGAEPQLAFTVLLNVLGSLIGTQLVEHREECIAKAQAVLPMYVEAYRVKEIKIGGQ